MPQTRRPHLFVLHIWLEELDEDHREWRGSIEYPATHEKRYFREWQVLIDFMQQACEQLSGEQAQRQNIRADDFPAQTNNKQE